MVSKIRSTFLLGCLLVLNTLVGQNHSDITFDAEVGKQKMLINSTVEFKITLRNANGSDFRVPAFKDFNIISGPGQTRGNSIINGVASSYISFSWLLQPKRTGRLSIEPASVRANNRGYRTNSKAIEVLPVDAGLAAQSPDNFMQLELSHDTAYVGQQIIMNLQLYTTDNVVSRNLVAEPNLDNFYTYPRRQFDGRSQNVLEGGKEYLSRTVASIALYPTKSGELIIEPYRLLLGVIRYRNPQSSFSRRYTERIPLQTDSVKIMVKELPLPRPDNFSGGVGTYRMQATADKQTLSTDDAITIRVIINGEGDVKRITTPTPVSKKDWVIYDPTILTEDFIDGPTGMYGKKVFQYQIVPRRAGESTLTPSFNYFDVDSNRYINLTDASYPLKITQGSGSPVYEVPEDTAEANTLALLPATELATLKSYQDQGMGPTVFWSLAILPLLLFGGYFYYDQRQQALANLDPAEVAQQKAARLANDRLKVAKQWLDQQQARPFYDAIEDATLGYLRDKFQLPIAELTKKNIHQQLLAHGASSALADDYVRLLKRCEMALYAGQVQAADLTATYETAKGLILRTEKVK
ncbi:MAG: BatD family protein [Bacteroidota bacterium]